MLGTILKVGYLCAGRVGVFFCCFCFQKVRLLRKSLGKGQWHFQVRLAQFVRAANSY